VCDQDEESLLMSRGSHACPCVESIQGSSLLPVNVARKITLVGRNLDLYQVMQDLEACWSLIVHGQTMTMTMIIMSSYAYVAACI